MASDNALGVKITRITADGKTVDAEASEEGTMPKKLEIPLQEEGASVWQEFTIQLEKCQSFSATAASASVSNTNLQDGFWFTSGSMSETIRVSASTQAKSARNTSLQIGFRVMKVTINRPWMDAGILAQSKEFYLANASRISQGSPETIIAALNKPTLDEAARTLINDAEKAILPTWPVAFIVAKDLHIILKSDVDFESNEVEDMQKHMSSGGGFLCFSCAKSEASEGHRTAAAVTHDKNNMSIKIPAPQIIGWVGHFCPEDETQKVYTKLAEDEFKRIALPATQGSTPLLPQSSGLVTAEA
ncbi:hypothetical protein MMC16_004056 [Acarospora aff. strigata]|nr:hypothetical protein [Acarospora aff. strigata]